MSIVVGILKSGDRRLMHPDKTSQRLLAEASACPGLENLSPYICIEPFSLDGGGKTGIRRQPATNEVG